MTDSDEFKKGWLAALALDRDGDAKNEQRFIGRFGLSRKRRLNIDIEKNNSYLTPPARRNAIAWQRQVLRLLKRIPNKRERSLARLTSDVMTAAVKEGKALSVSVLTLGRFLNRLGYLDKPGRRRY